MLYKLACIVTILTVIIACPGTRNVPSRRFLVATTLGPKKIDTEIIREPAFYSRMSEPSSESTTTPAETTDPPHIYMATSSAGCLPTDHAECPHCNTHCERLRLSRLCLPLVRRTQLEAPCPANHGAHRTSQRDRLGQCEHLCGTSEQRTERPSDDASRARSSLCGSGSEEERRAGAVVFAAPTY